MEDNKIFIDIRQNISTVKNNSFSVISPFYDKKIQVINKYDDKCQIKDLHSDNYHIHSLENARKKLILHNVILDILVILISLGVEVLRNTLTFKFIGFEPNFLKYFVFELSIILLYLNFCNSLAKECCFKKYNYAERQTLLHVLASSNHFPFVNNEIALSDVNKIVDFNLNHYFGENKKIGRDYLNNIKKVIKKKSEKSLWYDAFNDYQTKVNRIEGKHSIPLAIFSLVIGITVQIVQIVNVWQDVVAFKANIISTSIVFPFILFIGVYVSLNNRYKKIWYELETDYLIFNYQNNEMPFSLATPTLTFVFPTEIHENVVKEEIIKRLVKDFNNELILEFVSYRSFKFINDDTLVVYGISKRSVEKIQSIFVGFLNKEVSDLFK